MATKLEKPLKREITIHGKPFVITVGLDTLELVGKGRRKGLELTWADLTSGEAALAAALTASLDYKLPLEPADQVTAPKSRARSAPERASKAGSHGRRTERDRTARRRAH